jgi:YidC/Oxa1 family membrane protein insertase
LAKAAPLLANGAFIRFQSTTPAPAAPVEAVSNSSFTTTPLDSFDINTTSVLDIPERIGYLKELGLDYGWGPTAIMEWILEHIHVLAGTPWWASIGLTAIAVRVLMFKPYMDAADVGARMQSIKHITAPITQALQESQRAGDVAGVFAKRAELKMVHQRAGINFFKSLVPMFQVFAGYGSFVLLRGMANLPVPGLETGGVLWFQNLTIPDPYILLPLGTAAILHYVLRVSSPSLDAGVFRD